MKKVILLILISATLLVSCQKSTVTSQSSSYSDTTFVKYEKLTKFYTPEAGVRVDYIVKNCTSVQFQINTNDGKGWISTYGRPNVSEGLLYFCTFFRYKYHLVLSDSSTYDTQEKIWQY